MNKIISIIIMSSVFFFSCEKDTKKDSSKDKTVMQNPLLEKWNTPFGVPPFDKIKSEHYLPAFKEAISLHQKEIEQIESNKENPTFKNTIEALELSGATLKKITNVFFAVSSANTDDVIKKSRGEIMPMLSAHYDKINLNEKLFNKVKYVYDAKPKLTAEENRLLSETYKNYTRAGVNLKGEKKERLKEINTRLAKLSTKYGDNLLDETNSFELHITDEKDLGTISESLKASSAEEAKKRGHDKGWSFTLQRPSINPFLQACPNPDHRKTMFDGYANRANNNNDKDNKAVLLEMVNLRIEKANLLGFKSHADYVLSNRMAENAENVNNLLSKLWTPALNMAKAERDALTKTMKDEGVKGTFKGSDWRYYVEKVRARDYNFNEEETRPYFEFTAVLNGAFNLANKLFGFNFKELNDVPKWHKDQKVYEVLENDGTHIGVIYMDFFTRDSKRSGAWMNNLRDQSNVGSFVAPIVTNNFNYPPPTKDTPSLLSFTEAQTLFHEFGHGLHGLLSKVKYASLSGTNVPRDFVEFPSQVMENWMSEPEVLATYAKHYKTGEVIPTALINKMNKANGFNDGFRTVEYMAAAYLDLAWHSLEKQAKRDVNAFEKEQMDNIGLIDEIIPRYRSTYYSHIFSGGYSAGYYSYLWSEILDADTFAAFKETGNIFDKDLAERYRKMLESGGTKSGKDLFKDFMGREPNIDALLKKKGFQK